ncbi:MAG: hypothetical protein IPM81_19025 [Saprospirales bacterium]|nr:hypothetical protein [Saprospirales bacterium]
MMKFYILGQSNYAVCVLLDTLRELYPGTAVSVEIVANIPPEQNDSLRWPYNTPGISAVEITWAQWQPEPDIPCLPGSIGRSRRANYSVF